ncbi:MAG: hypothetical protein J6V06_02190 [Clostridia bacterium]|nr:hypothetical protein [Clostridia bacterium]MBO7318816.1 hypothetical protein [Clostridia bacterium]
MKKFLPIILIIALAVMVMCFAACGNNTADDTLTSMSNEMTSIMDDATTLGDALEEDMTDLSEELTGESANGNDLTDENMSGMSDVSDNTSVSSAE